MQIFWNTRFGFDSGWVHMRLYLREWAKFGLFWDYAEIKNFFAVDILNCTVFLNWLSKYVTALPKIGKIHAFFMTNFFKFEIFVYIGHINMQFSLKTSKDHLFFMMNAKKLFFPADFCNLVLKISNYFTEIHQILHFFHHR